jgi:hypothetical protein
VSQAQGGQEIFVANDKSLLTQVMPHYQWSGRD